MFKFSKKEIARLLCLIISGVSVIIGYSIKNFNVLCTSMIFLLIHNIIYVFENTKDRVIFLILHITIFTFLISNNGTLLHLPSSRCRAACRKMPPVYFPEHGSAVFTSVAPYTASVIKTAVAGQIHWIWHESFYGF